MLTPLYRSTAVFRTLTFASIGVLSLLATACGNGSDNDDVTRTDTPDITDNAPQGQPIDLAGTWILTEVSEESFGAWNNNVLVDELKFRKVSRQLVTITQQGDTAQIQLCGETATTAKVSTTGLEYNANIYMPTINSVTDLTPIVRPLVLASDADGALHGTLDTGLMPVLSEPYPNSYRVTKDVSLARISTSVSESGIGSLILDWSFLVTAGFTTTERRDETVSCFVESVRTRSGGEQVLFYGVSGGASKSLMLDAQTMQVTFTDDLYSANEASVGRGAAVNGGSHVKHSVTLALKPVISTIGFGQSLNNLTAEEEGSFTEASPTLLRQQYLSAPSSLAGAIDVEYNDQFMHAQFDLNW